MIGNASTRLRYGMVGAAVLSCASALHAGPPPSPAPAAAAIPPVSLELDLGRLSGYGWQAESIMVQVEGSAPADASGHVSIARLMLPRPLGELAGALNDVAVECATVRWSVTALRCHDAVLRVGDGALDGILQSVAGDLDYGPASKRLTASLTVHLQHLPPVHLNMELGSEGWCARTRVDGLQLDALRREALWRAIMAPAQTGAPAGDDAAAAAGAAASPPAALRDWSLAGTADLEAEFCASAGALRVRFSGRLRDITLSNPAGTFAADGVTIAFSGDAHAAAGADAPALRLEARSEAGEAYAEPLYVNFAEHPLQLQASGHPAADAGVSVQAEADLADVARLQVEEMVLRAGTSQRRLLDVDGRIDVVSAQFPGAYQTALQPFLVNSPLGRLETAGAATGTVRVRGSRIVSGSFDLQDVYLEDRGGRIAVYAVNGRVYKPAGDVWQPQQLAFDGGFLYRIAFGTASARFTGFDDRIGWQLAAPVQVPVLDGHLELARLEVRPGTDGPDSGHSTAPGRSGGTGKTAGAGAGGSIRLEAKLAPVGMRSLAHAVGWPPLAGTLSGRIPSVTYEDGELSIAGDLQAQVFDGEVTVRTLRVRDPFGERPIARGDVLLEDLDLDLLSSTFSFGRMTGRVDGAVRELVLLRWSPVQFDAVLQTAEGDRSRHRISQRAVENLARLGGGVAGGLQTGFLRFFDEFAYDRLRIGCRLRRGVCEMSGLASTEDDSFLILRGRGLPRLDVVGHVETVDWPRLLAQLRAVMEREAPGPTIR